MSSFKLWLTHPDQQESGDAEQDRANGLNKRHSQLDNPQLSIHTQEAEVVVNASQVSM